MESFANIYRIMTGKLNADCQTDSLYANDMYSSLFCYTHLPYDYR